MSISAFSFVELNLTHNQPESPTFVSTETAWVIKLIPFVRRERKLAARSKEIEENEGH